MISRPILSDLSAETQSYDFIKYTRLKDSTLYMSKCGGNIFEPIKRSFLKSRSIVLFYSFKTNGFLCNLPIHSNLVVQLWRITSLVYHVHDNRKTCLSLFSEVLSECPKTG